VGSAVKILLHRLSPVCKGPITRRHNSNSVYCGRCYHGVVCLFVRHTLAPC